VNWLNCYEPTELIRNTARGTRVAEAVPRPACVGVDPDRTVFKVKASDRRFSGWGAYTGFTFGSFVGGLLFAGSVLAAPFTGRGSLVVGAAIAAGLSVVGGTALGGRYGAAKPQKAHLDAALRRLHALEVRFTKAQAQNVAGVTDEQWRELLHVPDEMVAGRADRQKVRTLLVHNVARHGFEFAKQNKDPAMRSVATGLIDSYTFDLDEDLEDPHTLDLSAIDACARTLGDLRQGVVNKQGCSRAPSRCLHSRMKAHRMWA
jgi:hypothetical protein